MEKLALGAVQLGLPYGAANQTGMPTADEATEIIRLACEARVPFVDTAHIYGESEARIGAAFAQLVPQETFRPHVVTKIGMTQIVNPELCPDAASAEQMVNDSVQTSLSRLQCDVLDTVLLHSFAGYKDIHSGAPWRQLVHLRDIEGCVRRIGVSCYTPEEVMLALLDVDVQHIQLPFNLLDSRFKTQEFVGATKTRPDITIHTRSCFLQGLLVSGVERWPPFAQAEIAPAVIAELDNLVSKLNRQSRVDLCLAYSRGTSWISQVLVGSETAAQFRDTLNLFGTTMPLTPAEIQTVDRVLDLLQRKGLITPRLLNPGLWIPQDEVPHGYDMAQGMYRGPGSTLKLDSAKL